MNESALWSLLANIEHTQRERETDTGNQKPENINKGIYLDALHFSFGKKVVLKNASLDYPRRADRGDRRSFRYWQDHGCRPDHRTFPAPAGHIYIDDTPLDQLNLHAWRHLIGYVPQEMFLFHDTIYKNISLGDDNLSRADVEAALRSAGAWNFVSGPPIGAGHSHW